MMEPQTTLALRSLFRGPAAAAGATAFLKGFEGPPVSARSRRWGNTLLHLASREGSVEACRALLPHYCIDMGNLKGATPLFLAAVAGKTDTVRLLLAEGADPCIPFAWTGAKPAEATTSPEIRRMLEAAEETWPFGGPRPVRLSAREAYLFRLYMRWLMALDVLSGGGLREGASCLDPETVALYTASGLQGLVRKCQQIGHRARAARAWRVWPTDRCLGCGTGAKRRCTRCRSARYCGPACQRADWAKHLSVCRELAPGCHHCGKLASASAGGKPASTPTRSAPTHDEARTDKPANTEGSPARDEPQPSEPASSSAECPAAPDKAPRAKAASSSEATPSTPGPVQCDKTMALRRCSRCSEATYCDRKCQMAAWPLHKLDCKPLSPDAELQRLAALDLLVTPAFAGFAGKPVGASTEASASAD